MAGIHASPLVLLSLLVLAMASTRGTDATFISIPQLLIVTGTLCCTQTGNCPGTPVVGAPVSLTCPGTFLFPTVVGTNVTDVNGAFSITANVTTSIPLTVSSILSCLVTVPLPVNASVCPVLSTSTGRLVGIPVNTQTSAGVQTAVVMSFIPSS